MQIKESHNKLYSPLAWLWFAIALACYVCMAIGGVSITAILAIASMFVTFILAGDSFVRITLGGSQRFSGVPVRLLIGALISNIVFYLLALLLPFGLAMDWLIVIAIALSVWSIVRMKSRADASTDSHGADLLFAFVSTAAVMIWCSGILRPIETTGNVAILRAWPDVYYHMSEIGSLANSAGLAGMHDLQMAGAPVHAYHLASYVFPALLQRLTGIPAWSAFSGLLVPFGLLLTACAAFALAFSVFGKWPALIAGLSVLLIPDAVHQGLGNQLVGGYYWLQFIAPGGTYGVASAAVAFLFLLEASRTGRLALVAIGYFFVLVTLMFKAQIFVAISFPAFLFPALFMGRIRPKWRAALVLTLAAGYFTVLGISQLSPSVPVMRLDGSGLVSYSSLVMANQDDGIIRRFWLAAITAAHGSWILRALIFAPVIVITTFGFVAPIYLAVFSRIKKTSGAAVAFFPVMVMAVYVLMAICLSLDTRHIGSPEELLHRPFVWAYFILLIWTVAGAYRCLFGDRAPPSRGARYAVIAVALCLLAVPVLQRTEIQAYKRWGIEDQELPVCQVKAADFVRANSGPRDVIQDSLNDQRFILSGLSGRQSFAIDSGGIRAPAGVDARLASLRMVKNLSTPSQVEAFMKENSIAFYVTNPDDSVAWENVMDSHKVFQCDQYRVYRF
ncbi:UNVERIFIED_ORG: hypothetical protein J2Y81_003000 [Paraburkholderia sediminicola]|nr:hypothetical protein [Paraburkholderia sediminicola]